MKTNYKVRHDKEHKRHHNLFGVKDIIIINLFFMCKDLNHESNSLIIKNVSKSENHKYECVASNGILPSVSKKITLTVYCKFRFTI